MSVRVGKTHVAEAFPVAAKSALENNQLRANVRRATDTIGAVKIAQPVEPAFFCKDLCGPHCELR